MLMLKNVLADFLTVNFFFLSPMVLVSVLFYLILLCMCALGRAAVLVLMLPTGKPPEQQFKAIGPKVPLPAFMGFKVLFNLA